MEKYKEEGWKTYTSTQFGFSFLYPPRYFIEEKSLVSENQMYSIIRLREVSLRSILGTSTPQEDPPEITFAIYPNGKELTPPL